ncbi:cytochrome P450 [Martelella sp.]|uniref:cytochrome P450 n=1 Tax=Martelella sp. TaxID=1969699 RepID=UPI003242F35F
MISRMSAPQTNGGSPMRTLEPPARFEDKTRALLREGYLFMPRRHAGLEAPIFRTRLMLRNVVCLAGPEAARLFYTGDIVTRRGAMPQTTLRLLQDKHSVQQLDGSAHRNRKALFIRMLVQNPARIDDLVSRFRDAWLRRLPVWERQGRLVLSSTCESLLAEAALSWAGLPANEHAVKRDAPILSSMIRNAGRFGPATAAALVRRANMERRLRAEIRAIRSGARKPPDKSPAAEIARHRDETGALLSPSVAAVELLNILRPIVAVGRYIVFAAMMLHQKPAWRARFSDGSREGLDRFAEEVRRIAPFFPFIGGVLMREAECYGYRLEKGQWVLLDLYGTCHDPRWFVEPDEFRPERDLSWQKDVYRFIPQGGGDAVGSHRCPGERATVALIAEAVRLLAYRMSFEVPRQDLDVPLDTVPTGPGSGFALENIRRR